jgi:hypothetical protein
MSMTMLPTVWTRDSNRKGKPKQASPSPPAFQELRQRSRGTASGFTHSHPGRQLPCPAVPALACPPPLACLMELARLPHATPCTCLRRSSPPPPPPATTRAPPPSSTPPDPCQAPAPFQINCAAPRRRRPPHPYARHILL